MREFAPAYAHCEALARQFDKDRWLANLYAPAGARPHLNALLAFNYEVARLREILREPLAGEMRLTWWREAIEGERAAEARANPIAAALLDTMARFALPPSMFANLCLARVFDLYDDAMPTLHDLEGYCGETCSSLFQAGALILGQGAPFNSADVSGHAGVAYALTGLLRALPITSARGQCFLPRDLLAKAQLSPEDVRARRASPAMTQVIGDLAAAAGKHCAMSRQLANALPAAVQPAFAALSLVPLYLAQLQRGGASPFETIVEAPLYRKQWALWRGL